MRYMKKIIIIIILLIIPINVYANKTKVTLSSCIDGDTANFIENNEKIKVRFLAVNTPEIKTKDLYASEAKEFTCNLLTNAKEIYLEFDDGSDKTDKYGRTLAWIWADNILVQKELIKNGYAKVEYIYGNYKYTDELKELEKISQKNKVNIWSITETDKKNKEIIDKIMDVINKYYEYIIVLLGMILALLTYYNKIKREAKKAKKND